MPESAPVAAWHREYHRAHAQGWIPHFVRAGLVSDVRPEVLMAIASRETNMGGPELAPGVFQWLTRPGDGGHGFGLLQIDGRYFREWTTTEAWRRAEAGILKGAEVLAEKRDGLRRRAGSIVSVRDSSTRLTYRFKMPTFTGALLERVAIAAYNAGDWAAYHVRKGRSVDHGTQHQNYSADVLERAAQFHVWLVADGWLTPADEVAG